MIRIPGYIIKREIGSGGMAAVYLAVQTSLEREVALKVMAPALVADQTFSKRFLREARTVAGLSHPNIVAIYDVGITKNQLHYFSMQHLSHGDLVDRVSQGISERELIRILSGICEALHYAHGRGFVHRDVTPGNILFDASSTPVLTDFGIARAVTQSTKITGTGVSVGTSHYMSPEQARGRDVDPRSDIYSLGALVFEALAGRPPYDGEDGFAIAYSHVFDPVPTLPGRFERWQPFIDRAMAKKPEDRFDSAREVSEVLNQLLSSTTGDGRRPAPPPELSQHETTDTQRLPDVVERIQGSTTAQRSASFSTTLRQAWFIVCDRLFGFLPVGRRSAAGIMLALALAAGAGWMLLGREQATSPLPQIAAPTGASADETSAVPTAADQPSSIAAANEQPVGPPVEQSAEVPREVPDEIPALLDGFEGEAVSEAPAQADPVAAAPAPAPETVTSGATEVDPVAELLQRAEAQFSDNRLTSPVGDNALESYQAVLALDSDNASARGGTERIIDRYLALVNSAVEREQFAQATELLSRASGIRDRVDGLNPELHQQVDTAIELVFERVFDAGKNAVAAGRSEEAAVLLDSALQLQPDNSEAILARAELRTQSLSIGRPGVAASEVLRDPLSSGGFGPELIRVKLEPFLLMDGEVAHQVGGGGQIGVSTTEITVADYRRFIESAELGDERPAACRNLESAWRSSRSRTWSAPGFEQGEDHPVTCVSWQRAVDYAEWLSAESGQSYRLLSETEWDYLYRQREETVGNNERYCEFGNVADRWLQNQIAGAEVLDCEDGWAYTAPVGSYRSNRLGLHDLIGNVREWVADCWSLPRKVNGYRVDFDGDCGNRVVKGTAWLHEQPGEVESLRRAFSASAGFNTVGFRVARTLD